MVRKSLKNLISQIKFDKYYKNILAKGNKNSRQKAKKFNKKFYNKLVRLNNNEEIKKCLN